MQQPMFIKTSDGRYQTTRPITEEELFLYASELLEADLRKRPGLKSSTDVAEFLRLRLGHEKREVFSVIFLDHKHRMLKFEVMFMGTINAAIVYPREVVRRALEVNAVNIILAHNHPSGDPEPSKQDFEITRRISDALRLVEIRVLDHLVVCRDSFISLSERDWRMDELHSVPR
ncbi:JAB domain-containing protein [Alcanivorax quisquiliarum]|uniref:DNA repair protein RadC n=1 Tax=Alcanivorax quisquiliarum TaxID=2933565 RepID=A0ABT0EA92_9GAMM|nr:DNA repair protein RadC [Alcanivorax quisquiliarum]MCK0538680.1 DNA repair protein RadC [Alcanivorax quisquiliarum]